MFIQEGREGVKWELGLAYKNGNGIEIMPVDFQFLHLLNLSQILTAGMSSTKIIIKNI